MYQNKAFALCIDDIEAKHGFWTSNKKPGAEEDDLHRRKNDRGRDSNLGCLRYSLER